MYYIVKYRVCALVHAYRSASTFWGDGSMAINFWYGTCGLGLVGSFLLYAYTPSPLPKMKIKRERENPCDCTPFTHTCTISIPTHLLPRSLQRGTLNIEFNSGAVYMVVITENRGNVSSLVEEGGQYKVTGVEIDEQNSVSIFLQVPMYVVITAGEVMFSITGLEFAYSQVSQLYRCS